MKVYGVQCAPWDAMPGTPWYSGSCDTSAGKHYCKESDGWCDDPWCYVDKDTCNTWQPTVLFEGVAGTENLGWSYEACKSPDCYSLVGHASYGEHCPYDP